VLISRFGQAPADHPGVEGSEGPSRHERAELQAYRGQPERRGGYMPSQVMTSALKEAKRRGIPIDERVHAP
jgi:hypothetical protein